MDDQNLPRKPLDPLQQLLLADLQRRADLVKAVRAVEIFLQPLIADPVAVVALLLVTAPCTPHSTVAVRDDMQLAGHRPRNRRSPLRPFRSDHSA